VGCCGRLWPALVVAVLLAGLAGFVDAIAFDRFRGVFAPRWARPRPGTWRWSMVLASVVVGVAAVFWLVGPQRVLGDVEAPQ